MVNSIETQKKSLTMALNHVKTPNLQESKTENTKGYWKDGYFYISGRILCGICSRDMGKSKTPEGDLSYCNCEEGCYYE